MKNIPGYKNGSGHKGHKEDAKSTKDDLGRADPLSRVVIGAAIEVHKELGPGLLESAYQRALAHELELRGLQFVEQQSCPVSYKDLLIDDAYRIDFLVGDCLIVELKAVDSMMPVHEAQVLTYLKFSQCRLGLILNFRTRKMKEGINRLIL